MSYCHILVTFPSHLKKLQILTRKVELGIISLVKKTTKQLFSVKNNYKCSQLFLVKS